MTHTVGISAVVLYLISAILFLTCVVSRRSSSGKVAACFFWAGFSLHCVLVLVSIGEQRLLPVDGVSDYQLWISWVVALCYCILARKIHFPIIGAFVTPAVALFLVSSSILAHRETYSSLQEGGLLMFLLHVLPAIVSEVSLVFAFIVGIVFLLQEHRIKLKSVDVFSIKGPSLNLLERLNRRFVLIGFVAMTLAVISGSVWAASLKLPLFSGDPTQVSALCAWLLLAVLLHLRVAMGISAHRLSQFTVLFAGAFFLAVFMLVYFNGSGLHENYIS